MAKKTMIMSSEIYDLSMKSMIRDTQNIIEV